MKTDIATGNIQQQVQIYSLSASIACSSITVTGLALAVVCSAVYYGGNITRALIISIDRELTFSKLPEGFRRYENDTFAEESVAFKRTFLPLAAVNLVRSSVRYAFNTSEGFPARQPSVASTHLPSTQPSTVPSGQPSSSPTSAPSISPQPTSHPSSSGPTNTYKPTVKPTQLPSRVPSREPTRLPSVHPTVAPTVRPSALPSVVPTAQPSVLPTVRPTRCPSVGATRTPSVYPTCKPTATPTESVTVSKQINEMAGSNDQAYAILGYVVVGLFGAWFLYYLRHWCAYRLEGVQSDANRAVYAASMDAKPKPRFPIFAFFVSLFVTVQGVEVDFITIKDVGDTRPARKKENSPTELATNGTFNGVGAFIDGLPQFKDLEANHESDDDPKTTTKIPDAVVFNTDPQRETAEMDRQQYNSEISSVSSEESHLKSASNASSDVNIMLSAESSFISDDANSLLDITSIVKGGGVNENYIPGEQVAANMCIAPLQPAIHSYGSDLDSVDYSLPSSDSENSN